MSVNATENRKTVAITDPYGHFFDARVDTVRKALEKLAQKIDESAQEVVRATVSGVSVAQLRFFDKLAVHTDNVRHACHAVMDKSMNDLEGMFGRTVKASLQEIDGLLAAAIKKASDAATPLMNTAQHSVFVDDIPFNDAVLS